MVNYTPEAPFHLPCFQNETRLKKINLGFNIFIDLSSVIIMTCQHCLICIEMIDYKV